MDQQIKLSEIDAKIQSMKKTAAELKSLAADNFPALARNTVRLLASLKMLELNVSDVFRLDEKVKKPSKKKT